MEMKKIDDVLIELNGLVRKCESQSEFDDVMHRINDAETAACLPYRKEQEALEMQRSALNLERERLQLRGVELSHRWQELELERKSIGCDFWELKHRLIGLNPKGDV